MAHLCLENSELVVAEQFSDEEVKSLLAPASALLYPSLDWLPKAPNQSDGQSPDSVTEQLVVIDATWRKSKKILHLHPELQELNRISLEGYGKSKYRIRSSSMDHGLSTLESVVEAMGQLEPKMDFSPMLKPFEKMISLQRGSFEAGRARV